MTYILWVIGRMRLNDLLWPNNNSSIYFETSLNPQMASLMWPNILVFMILKFSMEAAWYRFLFFMRIRSTCYLAMIAEYLLFLSHTTLLLEFLYNIYSCHCKKESIHGSYKVASYTMPNSSPLHVSKGVPITLEACSFNHMMHRNKAFMI